MNRERKYWVVSPNVNNNNQTVGDWRQATVRAGAAFMGWKHDDPEHANIGPKFAGKDSRGIQPGDAILIARRYKGNPEMVGFGAVEGPAEMSLSDFAPPAQFGSLRRLRPFVAWSEPPSIVPIGVALRHTMALAQLHPEANREHAEICAWIDSEIESRSQATSSGALKKTASHSDRQLDSGEKTPNSRNVSIVSSSRNFQFDYQFRTKGDLKRAKKKEASLLEDYKSWLDKQNRTLEVARYGRLQCDGYERKRSNLIEAKSSESREFIRMAVGQLLDYGFQGKQELGRVNMAILVATKPADDIVEWLTSLDIKLIWLEGDVFLDNANGQFT